MALKAILFDFNGVIINDEMIHQELVDDLLLEENIVSASRNYSKYCLGRSDRACLRGLLTSRGRLVTEEYLDILISRKAQAYKRYLEQLITLPSYPGLKEFLEEIQTKNLHIGLVTGALRSEAVFVLEQMELVKYFEIIVGGDEIKKSKPDPEGYLLAIKKFNQFVQLSPSECLAIEDSPAGIKSAKKAGIQVVGIANTYPFHFMQRLANWAVDYLDELELERIEAMFETQEKIDY